MEVRARTRGFSALHKALGDPVRVRIIELLWAGPRSAKELAASVELPPDRVYYHLNKLEAAGLIRIEGYRELGGGKVERVYRQVETEPPGDDASPEEVTEFLDAMLEATRLDLRAAGTRKAAGGRGERSLARHTVFLAPEELAELRQRLDDLVAEYRHGPAPGAHPVRAVWTLIELGGRGP